MTFPRIRPPGMYILGSVLEPSEIEQFDDHQSKAIDGYAGGTYAPGAATGTAITIGGLGVIGTGPFVLQALSIPATYEAVVEATATLTIDGIVNVTNGGALVTDVGSTSAFNGDATINGTATVNGSIVITNTGDITVNAGGQIACAGDITINGAGSSLVIGADASASIGGTSGHDAVVDVNQYGFINIQSGGGLECYSGSNFFIDTGCSYEQRADNARTGADIPSGSGAYSALRSPGTGPTSSGSVNTMTYDMIKVANGIGTPGTVYTLTTPTAPLRVVLYTRSTTAMANDMEVWGNAATPRKLADFLYAAATYGCVTFLYDGTDWIVESASGAGAVPAP